MGGAGMIENPLVTYILGLVAGVAIGAGIMQCKYEPLIGYYKALMQYRGEQP